MDMDSNLVNLAIDAIRTPEQWQRVLQHIMAVTGAPAAMITLRDSATCQIVNDDALEREYHSPMISGFPPHAVTFYLNELRTIDPWAVAQRMHPPFIPVAMSQICPPGTIQDTRFFSWLAGLV